MRHDMLFQEVVVRIKKSDGGILADGILSKSKLFSNMIGQYVQYTLVAGKRDVTAIGRRVFWGVSFWTSPDRSQHETRTTVELGAELGPRAGA